MATEIERRFLIDSKYLPIIQGLKTNSNYIEQAYLATRPVVVRARVMTPSRGVSSGFVTVKGKQIGISTPEEEVSIPIVAARSLIDVALGSMPQTMIRKTRYDIPHHDGLIIEVDVFDGELSGLVIAEVELVSEDQQLEIPNWFGLEISESLTYKNVSLATTDPTIIKGVLCQDLKRGSLE